MHVIVRVCKREHLADDALARASVLITYLMDVRATTLSPGPGRRRPADSTARSDYARMTAVAAVAHVTPLLRGIHRKGRCAHKAHAGATETIPPAHGARRAMQARRIPAEGTLCTPQK